MTAYRYKTPGRNSVKAHDDEVVEPQDFWDGLTVWVPGPNGREQHICTGPFKYPLTLEQYRERGKAIAAQNRATFSYRRRGSRLRPEHHSFALS